MRLPAIALVLVAASAYPQSVSSVYNRDTHEPFKLKNVKVWSTVVGPIVRTSTLLTYDNPYKTLTEATLNFDMEQAAALSGFAYFYGDEYVPGQLMDKDKAWFIYTAITSRNRDPGIMEQWSPTDYHCQIYPIMQGRDLRVRLYSVGFLKPSGTMLSLPKPSAPRAVGYETVDGTLADLDWNVRTVRSGPAVKEGADFKVPDLTGPARAVAQKFKDGRVYVAGLMRAHGDESQEPTFAVLRDPKVVHLDPDTIAFMGWLPHNKKIAVRHNGVRVALKPERINSGSDAAKLWAQQMLATARWTRKKDVLHFSLKYGVPSNATALLAVPSEQMRLFRDKEKKWQEKQAEQRRREREQARQRRGWNNGQNWSNGGGGDPEIRVTFAHANAVEAILPDRRVIELVPNGDVWGGNFEIPATAPEGEYRVRIVAHLNDGTVTERSWTYRVDRTPPTGTTRFVLENGRLFLEVRSAKQLAEVAAYAGDGRKWVLKQVEPGVYRVEVPPTVGLRLTVVMKDSASNKGEITCSWQG
jgi:hypothetical protein